MGQKHELSIAYCVPLVIRQNCSSQDAHSNDQLLFDAIKFLILYQKM